MTDGPDGSGTRATSTPAGLRLSALGPRVVTGVVYGVALLLGTWFGGIWLAGIISAMSAFAAWEFYQIVRREQRLPNELYGVFAAALMPIAAAVWGPAGLPAALTALVGLAIPWAVLYTRVRTADIAVTVFGAVYTGFMLSYLVLIRDLEHGRTLALLVIVSVWVSDVFAYFVGSLLGRHKLAPRISPKKSWEGFAGGFAGTVAVWCTAPWLGVPAPLWLAAIIGAAVAIAALVGDLFESRIKREAGTKDSSDLLPGHGGFLDRLDSTIFSTFVVYWLLVWGGIA